MRIYLDFSDKEIGIIRDALYHFARSPTCCRDSVSTLGLLDDINEVIEMEEQRKALDERSQNLDRKRNGHPSLGFGYAVDLTKGKPV